MTNTLSHWSSHYLFDGDSHHNIVRSDDISDVFRGLQCPNRPAFLNKHESFTCCRLFQTPSLIQCPVLTLVSVGIFLFCFVFKFFFKEIMPAFKRKYRNRGGKRSGLRPLIQTHGSSLTLVFPAPVLSLIVFSSLPGRQDILYIKWRSVSKFSGHITC